MGDDRRGFAASLRGLWESESGQALTEYGLLLLVLITGAVIVALTVFGGSVAGLFSRISSILP